ncbi:MAG: DEAD/DEAH box helicase, partial [Proteobacteria bacterium]|nr:DEAD/DEAH box helicase [Pseudomonadota bacterium]
MKAASKASSEFVGHGSDDGSTFDTFGLADQLLANLGAMEITTPTPIQRQAIPVVLAGTDVVGLAQTGTGKTAAFMLPIIQKLLSGKMGTLRALVVVPTRELAEQVLQTARALAEGTGLKATSVYGGVRIDHHKDRLRKPLDLIVGCPGRLLDLLQQRALNLSSIEHLVLDEADQMFDMGFIEPIRKLLRATPKERQTLLFSATMPPEIEELTREALHKPTKIQVAPISSPDSVTHLVYRVPSHLKQQLLSHLLGSISRESVLVFTRTKHKARKLSRALEREGVKATCLQGNLSQSQRMNAMRGFRDGTYSVMVATDIASRGIDISSVSHVVNFDFPDTHEAYLHRTGRTGRATRTGDALTFIAPEDEGDFRRLERSLRIPFVKKEAEGFDYTAKAAPRESDEQQSFSDRPKRAPRSREDSRPFRRGSRGGPRRGGADRGAPHRSDRRSDTRFGGERSEQTYAEERSSSRFEGERSEGGFETERSKSRFEGRRSESRFRGGRSNSRFNGERSESRPSGERSQERSGGARSESRFGEERSQSRFGGARGNRNDRGPRGQGSWRRDKQPRRNDSGRGDTSRAAQESPESFGNTEAANRSRFDYEQAGRGKRNHRGGGGRSQGFRGNQ